MSDGARASCRAPIQVPARTPLLDTFQLKNWVLEFKAEERRRISSSFPLILCLFPSPFFSMSPHVRPLVDLLKIIFKEAYIFLIS